ncbi:MAG: hypothetical protein M5U09_24600 [Gammaproteobacteria bacterium]|nr:hypothetical protein [Gammaproteobacteria bacterium]
MAAFDFLYLPRLHRRGYVAPDPAAAAAGGLSSPGGYVLDSTPGLFEDVPVFDFKSLYPSIIRTFLIDPLALWLPGGERVAGFDGASFSRDAPILPDIIGELWRRRDAARAARNQPLSQAVKIIMNSFYGVLGASGCRFCDARLTSSITRRGHEIIRRSKAHIEAQGLAVIYGDTDSLFVWLDGRPGEGRAAATGRALAAELNDFWKRTIREEHDLASFLEIEFESHYLKFLMPTVRGSGAGSKKRYAGMVRTSDGGTALVFRGLETVRSDWTALARRFQHELFRRIFNDQPYEAYVREVHSGLYRGEFDDALVYRKQLRQRSAATGAMCRRTCRRPESSSAPAAALNTSFAPAVRSPPSPAPRRRTTTTTASASSSPSPTPSSCPSAPATTRSSAGRWNCSGRRRATDNPGTTEAGIPGGVLADAIACEAGSYSGFVVLRRQATVGGRACGRFFQLPTGGSASTLQDLVRGRRPGVAPRRRCCNAPC